MADTPLGNAINFLKDFGFFDVVLPFLLVFTLVYAVLERTRLFGEEDVDGKKYTRKNVNAMVAFVVGLLVVGAANMVEVIKEALPQISIVLIMLVSIMLLIGVFVSSEKPFDFEQHKPLKIFLMVVIFVSVVLIFFNIFEYKDTNKTWLEYGWEYVVDNWESGPVVSSFLLLGVIIFVIYYVVGFGKGKEGEEGK